MLTILNRGNKCWVHSRPWVEDAKHIRRRTYFARDRLVRGQLSGGSLVTHRVEGEAGSSAKP